MPDRPVSRLPYSCAIAVTALSWLVVGLFGREPWKADEGYSFGLVLSMIEHGQWLVPTLAGEPFLEKPPLVFWLAALTGRLLQGLLPLHVAARGANVLLLGLAFGLIGLAAAQASDASGAAADRRRRAWLAVLLAAGSPALFVAARYLTADIGMLPAAAGVCLGFVRLQAGRRDAGLVLGLAAVAGLLSKGLILPLSAAGAFVLYAITAPADSRRRVLWQGAVAVLVLVALGGVWPWLLHARSPDLFWVWLWDNNFERFLGGNSLGPANSRIRTLGALAGYLLPAWPMAVWYAATRRSAMRASPLYGAALFGLVWVAALMSSSTARVIYALPALVPLALVGAAAPPATVAAGRRWPARLVGSVVGLMALAATLSKLLLPWILPSSVHGSAHVSWPALALAGAMLLAWSWAVWRGARPRPLVVWTAGMTLAASLALGLYLPTVDARTGFRVVFLSMARYLPANPGCVASLALGESERAMLEYYVHLRTVRVEVDPAGAADCRLLLEQQRADEHQGFGCVGARELWSGSRGSDPRESFRLCERAVSPPSAGPVSAR